MSKNWLMLLFCVAALVKADGKVWNNLPDEHPLKAYGMYLLGKRACVVHGTTSYDLLQKIEQEGIRNFVSFIKDPDPAVRNYYLQMFARGQKCVTEEDYIAFANSLFQQFKDCDQHFELYFAPAESTLGRFGNVAMFVDPGSTYVYNGAYKAYRDNADYYDLYLSSRMLLSVYLRHVEKAKEMKRKNPDKIVALDPQSGEPFYMSDSSKQDFYMAEVPYPADEIKPSRLVRHQSSSFDVWKAMSKTRENFIADYKDQVVA